MTESGSTNWWTIPQAATWVLHRDLDRIARMEARSIVSLFIVDEVEPGTLWAAKLIYAALRKGLLQGYGQRSQKSGKEFIPQAFWDREAFFDEQIDVGVVARFDGLPPATLSVWLDAEACQVLWPMPSSTIPHSPMTLSAVLEGLHAPADIAPPLLLLTHPSVSVSGLNAKGDRVLIDRVALGKAFVDSATDSITTTDGRHSWSAVAVSVSEVFDVTARVSPVQPSEQFPTYAAQPTYRTDEVPDQFRDWAKERNLGGIIITVPLAEDAMRGPADDSGQRAGGLLAPGVGLSRETIRAWVKSLPDGWIAVQGTPPARMATKLTK